MERRQVRTIDDAITQAEALTDFRREKSLSAEGDDEVGSHDDSGEDSGEGEEQTPQPKRRDTYGSSGKKPGDRGNTARDSKDGLLICKRPHGYKRCPELKNLGAILRERKEKKAQEEVGKTKQLGVVSLCGAAIEQPSTRPRQGKTRQAEPKHAEMGLAKSKVWAQTVDITVNGKPDCALVDTGAEVNVMTKTAAKRLGLRYTSSNAQIKSVNASPTPIVGVAHGVNIMVGDWQGKTKFIIAPHQHV